MAKPIRVYKRNHLFYKHFFNVQYFQNAKLYQKNQAINQKHYGKFSVFIFSIQNSLVRILTAKERDRARAVFQSLDQDKDGIITAGEARRAQTSWFHKNNKESQSCSVR